MDLSGKSRKIKGQALLSSARATVLEVKIVKIEGYVEVKKDRQSGCEIRPRKENCQVQERRLEKAGKGQEGA